MSSDNENDYFCDGLTEEIINALAKINGLKVTSRTSSFFFKNKDVSVTKIGKELNVSTILEGSVRLSQDKIRITAQLIEVQSDFHFWSETWDRKLEDIFAVQDEISLLIADKIRENFGHFEVQDHLVPNQTDYIEAYRYYLKGNYHSQKMNPEDIELSKAYYLKALEIDPEHAQSNSGLSQYYYTMAILGFLPKAEAFEKAASLANRALKLNSQLAEAHVGIAIISYWYLWDLKKSITHLNKALEVNSSFVNIYIQLAFNYCSLKMFKKALKHVEIAIGLDPLSSEVYFLKGYVQYIMEEYEASIKALDICLERNPTNLLAITIKASCWLMQKKEYLVIDFFTSDLPATIDLSSKYGMLGIAHARLKDSDKTEYYKELLITEIKNSKGERAEFFMLLIWIHSGEKTKALNRLKETIKAKSTLALILFCDPLLNPIKQELLYKEIDNKLFSSTFLLAENKVKRKELLTQQQINKYTEKLISYISEESPYLNPDLNLKNLAVRLDIHPNQLSWLINHEFNKNFNGFINHYRVEAFKRISKDPKNSHITLIGLAYDSGFNSKTVFNTFFKKETGMTPMQYLKL
ncbi:helix-turn-helix domain-containing protein [Winogradskyella sp.]|uniref:helix-turn-helix domain-containing protein n=1 Tax=Winogradskyella sp. TaxID=1883156 RepID=UPI0025E406E2|nr:helix-turn-helix domain-containing protein [Winogradskyella sp.]